MARTMLLGLSAALLLSASGVHASPTVQTEFRDVLWKIAQHVDRHYVEEIPADSLVNAAARGIFAALDPASEYTLRARSGNLVEGFWTLMQMTESVSNQALYSVAPDTLIRFGVAGMMEILDPYTVFMEKRNLANFNIQTQGHYGGLGFHIQVLYPDSAIAVWSLLHEDTPAARAGVHSGDLILAIDDSTTRGMDAGDAADLMRGKPGTPVRLTLRRAGRSEPLAISIVREEIRMRSVPYHTLFADSTGYVKLVRFQSQCGLEVQEALADLQQRGMKRLIFDLRGNGGGYLQEAVEVADLFLPKDRLVVYTAGRAMADTARYLTNREALIGEMPLVVLVDRASASASEIVAGAVQDWDRGLILGTPTVGKGSVQHTVAIGENAELKLTMAAWHTPSGRSIDRRMRKDSTLVSGPEATFRTQVLGRTVRGGGGITPDVQVAGRLATPLYNQLSGWQSWDAKFFRFAREYQVHHPEVTRSFRAEAGTLREFREMLATQKFDYVSEAEADLKRLRERTDKDEHYRRLAKSLNQLQTEIDAVEEEHWRDDADLLSWRLTFDVLEKAFGFRAAYAYDCTVDPQVARAREILADPRQYQEWLHKPEIGLPQEPVAQEATPEDPQ
ncbi:MAG: S41 family peptidase [Candidatus Latescibacterota bacterium]